MTDRRRLVFPVSLVLLAACGGGGSGADGTPEPLLTANGTVSAGAQQVVPAYGASNVLKSGTVNVVFSNAVMTCSTLTASTAPDGIYVQVQISSAAKGVPDKHMVLFTIITGGHVSGAGSDAGTVEVLDVSDSLIVLRVAYQDVIEGTSYAVNGDFGVARCP
jgi:hypothetical protein